MGETRPTGRLKRAGGIVWFVYRSAVTGKYVTKAFAHAFPDKTIREKRAR